MSRLYAVWVGAACLAVSSFAVGQLAAPQAPATDAAAVDNEFVHKQFGAEFTLVPGAEPMARDLDGDGVEDLVLVAKSKKPMLDQAEHGYKVTDPYYAFYGYGDPKLTSTFGAEDPGQKNQVVLVIHGAGAEAWRAQAPKAKFVIINLPFKKVLVRRYQMGKKQVNAIFAVEADTSAGDSVVFWDGKKYRYQPIGTGGE
jgi:hypothetical protein